MKTLEVGDIISIPLANDEEALLQVLKLGVRMKTLMLLGLYSFNKNSDMTTPSIPTDINSGQVRKSLKIVIGKK
jgi:hypothetical protein